MAIIKETVKLYIIEGFTGRSFSTSNLAKDCPSVFSCLGEIEVPVEYDEDDLIDPRIAALNAAEAALQRHRAESHKKERQLLDRIESLRALPNGATP